MRGPPSGPRLGTPRTIACSTDETCSTRRRTGVVGRRPGGHAVRRRRRRSRPTRAGTTTRPASSASASTAIASRPSRTSNGTRSRRSSIARQPRPSLQPGGGSAAGRAGDGRRPRTRPRRRRGRRSARSAPARAPARRASATLTVGVAREQATDPVARPERAEHDHPATSATRPATRRSRGVTAAMIRAATRKGPKEPTRHVGVDAIAAVSVARPLRAGSNGTAAAAQARSMGPVHRFRRRSRRGYPPVRPHRLSAAVAARRPDRAR